MLRAVARVLYPLMRAVGYKPPRQFVAWAFISHRPLTEAEKEYGRQLAAEIGLEV